MLRGMTSVNLLTRPGQVAVQLSAMDGGRGSQGKKGAVGVHTLHTE
jgi:hypothetical protein